MKKYLLSFYIKVKTKSIKKRKWYSLRKCQIIETETWERKGIAFEINKNKEKEFLEYINSGILKPVLLALFSEISTIQLEEIYEDTGYLTYLK